MKTKRAAARNIDQYIAGFPDEVQEILEKIRMTIRKVVPDAKEKISYAIPTFTVDGKYLIYFAGYKNHVSIYPAPRGSEKFKEELAKYEGGKGTVRFPLDKPIPYGLIKRIVQFKVRESRGPAKGKKN